MSWLLHWEEELGKLDELLAVLAQAPPPPESEIAQEHIQSARSCVLGSMSAECELNLNLPGLRSGALPMWPHGAMLRRFC